MHFSCVCTLSMQTCECARHTQQFVLNLERSAKREYQREQKSLGCIRNVKLNPRQCHVQYYVKIMLINKDKSEISEGSSVGKHIK